MFDMNNLPPWLNQIPAIAFCYVNRQSSPSGFVYVSDACREIYELDAETFQRSRQLWRRILPEDRSLVRDSLKQNRHRWSCTWRIVTESGKLKWLNGAAQAQPQANGDRLWCGMISDISAVCLAAQQQQQQQEALLRQLQHTQTQLVQSEKMSSLGQLVAGVAHEINNPVNFIYGNLRHANSYTQDLLRLVQHYQTYYPNPLPVIQSEIDAIDLDFLMADLPKLLSSMKVGADRIREIVQSLRHFSRLDEAEVKPVNIHEGLESTLMILQNRIKAQPNRTAIEIVKDYGDLPLVECFAGQLNQVFMNMLVNAIDALEETITYSSNIPDSGGRPIAEPAILLRTIAGKNRVEIHIIDNGAGMPEAVRNHLFDPFFTTKPVGKGTGLGMSISHQVVVEKHQGELRCCSSPGQGTQFVINIPVKRSSHPS